MEIKGVSVDLFREWREGGPCNRMSKYGLLTLRFVCLFGECYTFTTGVLYSFLRLIL